MSALIETTTATIVCTRYTDHPEHGNSAHWQWEGPMDGLLSVTDELMEQEPDLFERMGLKMELVMHCGSVGAYHRAADCPSMTEGYIIPVPDK